MKLRNSSVQPSERSGTAAQLKGKLARPGIAPRDTGKTRGSNIRRKGQATREDRNLRPRPAKTPLQYGSSSISGASTNATGHSSPTLSDATGSRFSDLP